MGPLDIAVVKTSSTSEMTEQPFAVSAIGDSMDTDLLPELSGEMRVAAVHLDEATIDLPPPDSDPDLIASSLIYRTLTIVCTGRCTSSLGRTVPVCLRNSGHGVSSSAIYP